MLFRSYFYDNFLGIIKKARESYRLIRTSVGTWQTFAVPAEQPPVIDGREDDPVWKTAPVSFLVPWNPGRTGFRGGDTAEVRTTFKAAQDAKYLYFFVRCGEPDMAGIITDQKGPDNSNIWRDSDVEFFINASGRFRFYPYYGGKDFLEFQCGAGTAPELSFLNYYYDPAIYNHLNTFLAVGGHWMLAPNLEVSTSLSWNTLYNLAEEKVNYRNLFIGNVTFSFAF